MVGQRAHDVTQGSQGLVDMFGFFHSHAFRLRFLGAFRASQIDQLHLTLRADQLPCEGVLDYPVHVDGEDGVTAAGILVETLLPSVTVPKASVNYLDGFTVIGDLHVDETLNVGILVLVTA
jgi:hypothetical protein